MVADDGMLQRCMELRMVKGRGRWEFGERKKKGIGTWEA